MASGLLGDSSNGHVADIGAFMDSDIPGHIARIVDLGCLVSIGTTRDAGAISLTITHEGDWDREYFRGATDGVEWLEAAYKVLTARGLAPKSNGQPVPQKAVRRRSKLT